MSYEIQQTEEIECLFCFEVMVSHSYSYSKESLTNEALSSIQNLAGRTFEEQPLCYHNSSRAHLVRRPRQASEPQAISDLDLTNSVTSIFKNS